MLELYYTLELYANQYYMQCDNKFDTQTTDLATQPPLSPLLADIYVKKFKENIFKLNIKGNVNLYTSRMV